MTNFSTAQTMPIKLKTYLATFHINKETGTMLGSSQEFSHQLHHHKCSSFIPAGILFLFGAAGLNMAFFWMKTKGTIASR